MESFGRANWAKFVTEYGTVKEGKDLYELDNAMKKQMGKNKAIKVATTEEKGIKINLENKELISNEVLKLADTATSSTVEMQGNATTNITSIKEKYPIMENGKVENSDIASTLVETIKYTENITDEVLNEKVELYKVDINLLKLDIKNEYVINIRTGELYKLEGVQYQGKTYHRPDWGVIKNEEEIEDDKEKLTITPSDITIKEGETKQIKITLEDNEIKTNYILWKQEGEEQAEDEDGIIEDIEEYEDGEEGETEEIDENDYEDDVISIKGGVVTGEVVGETRVKAIYKKDGEEYIGYINVKVEGEEAEITEIQEVKSLEVNRGKTKAIKMYNSKGKRISNKKFTWTSADENIAKVSKKGVVTGKSGVVNSGKVRVTGTLKSDTNVKVEYEVTVLELTSFTPQLEIKGRNLVITNNIDKKYGMKYYTYKIDGQQVKKSKSKKYTAKNKVMANTTYKVEVIVSNGKYKVSSGEVSITSPTYCAGMEICNISPYGYDIYVYEVSDLIGKINFVVTTSSGTSKTITAEKVENKKYYARVNVSDFNNQVGTYTVKAMLYNTSNVKVEELTQNCDVPTVNTTVTNIVAESLVAGVRDNNIPDGYCDMTVNGKTYNLEVININDPKIYNENTDTYYIRQLTVGTYNQSRTAVIKCNNNLQIDGTITTGVGTIDGYESLTKVKGLFICSTGDLTNNGTITMTARGTYNTAGEDIYLWKNAVYEDESKKYEYVPAEGGTGGGAALASSKASYTAGSDGKNGTNRGTGGGGSGAAGKSSTSSASYSAQSGAGSSGTSYSGGTGGGGSYVRVTESSTDTAESGKTNGRAGGQGNSNKGSGDNGNYSAGGGAGNPGGYGEYNQHTVSSRTSTATGETGTGGLIVLYANAVNNNGEICSEGKKGGLLTSYKSTMPGGSSGGGSINIFYKNTITNKGKIGAAGGSKVYGFYGNVNNSVASGSGGYGAIIIGNISTGTFINDENKTE